jgi:hypothetical protein
LKVKQFSRSGQTSPRYWLLLAVAFLGELAPAARAQTVTEKIVFSHYRKVAARWRARVDSSQAAAVDLYGVCLQAAFDAAGKQSEEIRK